MCDATRHSMQQWKQTPKNGRPVTCLPWRGNSNVQFELIWIQSIQIQYDVCRDGILYAESITRACRTFAPNLGRWSCSCRPHVWGPMAYPVSLPTYKFIQKWLKWCSVCLIPHTKPDISNMTRFYGWTLTHFKKRLESQQIQKLWAQGRIHFTIVHNHHGSGHCKICKTHAWHLKKRHQLWS